MAKTLNRMSPETEPTAGEVFADAALVRAVNSYYVAGLLYREGHLIEAQTISRLMIEQIAFAYCASDVNDIEEAKAIKPTKSIGKLSKVIPNVGRVYGDLSNYFVHLPIEGHYLFIDLSEGASMTTLQFGPYSYLFGKLLAKLADCWADIYELTQRRHYVGLENWLEGSDGLTLNPERPFLRRIKPLCDSLVELFGKDYPTLRQDLNRRWLQEDE